MDENNASNQSGVSMADKFKLGRKWFWIGIAIALFNILSGFIFGIGLMMEKKYRREGLIIVLVAVAVTIATVYWVLINNPDLINAIRAQIRK
jgi:hypothetical protein